ncbi:MAG TPA: hypothetical protein VGD64_01165 [Acidisarcina sp.]
MGIYVDSTLAYVVNGSSLTTTLQLATGAHSTVLQEWDYCGGATSTLVPIAVTTQTGVWIVSPQANTTVGTLASFVATATTACTTGVSSIGVYVNHQLQTVVNGASLNVQLSLPPGAQQPVIQEWDNCGGTTSIPVNVTVTGTTLQNLQMSPGWKSSGQMAPYYTDCNAACTGVTLSMTQGLATPSLSGQSSQFNLGGTTPYSDALFYNQLIGAFSTQGLPDYNHTLVPAVHNFIYDAYFFVGDPAHTQAMEFDVNWFMNGVGMTWGTECRIAGGYEWDTWDNVNAKWVATGIPCNPLVNAWNHVTVNAQRTGNNKLLYQSIVLNGVTYNVNKTAPAFSVPQNWYGITANYQMDGDYKQTSITSYLDNFTFTYW